MNARKMALTVVTGCWGLLSCGCMDQVRANAGTDRTVDAGEVVVLDGSASTPGGRNLLHYQWDVLSGQTVSLTDANAAVTEFTAPQSANETTFRIQLTVTYVGFTGELVTENSDADEVVVRVHADPDADADSDATDDADAETVADAEGEADDATEADAAGDETADESIEDAASETEDTPALQAETRP